MNKTIELLQKLINHEKSARGIGNIAEAEAFAARIQELLLKHKIEMTDVEVAEQERDEPIEQDFVTANDLTGETDTRKRKESWIGILLMAVAKANFCEVVGAARNNAYHLIGRESDKQIAKQLFKYLYDACTEVVVTETSVYKSSEAYMRQIGLGFNSASIIRTFVSGFKLGFASAINRRLTAERDDARKKLAGGNETGLIRLDQIVKQVEDFRDNAFPHLRSGGSVTTRGAHGYQRGKAYGNAVGISGQARLKA